MKTLFNSLALTALVCTSALFAESYTTHYQITVRKGERFELKGNPSSYFNWIPAYFDKEAIRYEGAHNGYSNITYYFKAKHAGKTTIIMGWKPTNDSRNHTLSKIDIYEITVLPSNGWFW